MEENVQPAVPDEIDEDDDEELFRALVQLYVYRLDGVGNFFFRVTGTIKDSGNTDIVTAILNDRSDFNDSASARFIQDVEVGIYQPTFSGKVSLNTRGLLQAASKFAQNEQSFERDVVIIADLDFSTVIGNETINDGKSRELDFFHSAVSGKIEEMVSLPITFSSYSRLREILTIHQTQGDEELGKFMEMSMETLEREIENEEKEADDDAQN